MEILTEQKNQSSYSEVISLITGTNNSDKDITCNINETMCKLFIAEKNHVTHMRNQVQEFRFFLHVS